MDPRRIAGFATQFGGADSHTAIVARALGLPAVLAVPALIDHARAATTVVIDGAEGTVIIDPSAETVADYEARRDLLVRERRHLTRLRRLPAATRDGVEITLEANLELPVELDQALGQWGDGAGSGPFRVSLYEPRRPAGRGRAVRGVLGPGARHAGQARDRAHLRSRRRQARPLARRPLCPGRQPGARTARDPSLAAGPPLARSATGGDAARRRRRAVTHPVADDLDRERDPPGARGDGAGRPPAAASRHAIAQAVAAPWAR